MAPLLFKEMKGVNFSCASPASASICTSIDRRSMVRPSTGRAIDRHTPHLRDSRRAKTTTTIINSKSQAPSRLKTSLIGSTLRKSIELASPADHHQPHSPPGSQRYLLDDEEVFAVADAYVPTIDQPESALPPQIEPAMPRISVKKDEPDLLKQPSEPQEEQVVVLKVSLHCKGCQAKVKKHISKMEGVKSFQIDFPTKKVTVIGHVTPLGVLNSVSKVKNAQFWPSSPPPPVPAAAPAPGPLLSSA